jgi:hypothetical protein
MHDIWNRDLFLCIIYVRVKTGLCTQTIEKDVIIKLLGLQWEIKSEKRSQMVVEYFYRFNHLMCRIALYI